MKSENNTVDCLFIGYNDMNLEKYEKTVGQMGKNSGAYRDLNLNFIRYDNKPYHATGIFNLFCDNDKKLDAFEMLNPAVAYLGTYLHKNGLSFDYINNFQAEKDVLAEKLRRNNILTVAITTTFYTSAFPLIEIIDFIKTYNRSTKIIVGGPFVSTQVRHQKPMDLQTLFSCMEADFYINSSQGEDTLVKIITTLKHSLPLEKLNNTYYKSGPSFIETPVLKEDNKLNENMVDWNLFDGNLGAYLSLRTAISCPYKCAFCSFHENEGKYQTVEPILIENELNQLRRLETVKYIHFIDDTFNIPVKRFKEILKMMIKNEYDFKWHSYIRCQWLDRETVELMKTAGCEGVYLGLESGNDQMLKNMNKESAVEKYFHGISLLKEHGITTHGNFLLGFPGETEQTVQDTIHFIKESGIDFYCVQLWYYLHHTPIWRERERYKITGNSFDWTHTTMDWKMACDMIDDIFLSVENPTWVPQLNFSVVNLWRLVHRGFSIQQVKNFFNNFNAGIKEKLIDQSREEVDSKTIIRIKESCRTVDSNNSKILEAI